MKIELLDEKLTKLGIEAIIDFYKTMAIDQLQLPGLSAFVTGADSLSLNVVIDTRKNANFNLETIKLMSEFFIAHGVPWGWFITAAVETSNIKEHGFNLSYETPGMYFDLDNPLPEIQMDSIVIKEEGNDFKEWILPLQEGFPSEDNCEVYRKLNASLLNKGEKKLRHYSAYSDNESAVSGTLFLSDKSVMVHNLAAKNKFRKRGIGTALTVYMMSVAKKMGYKHCFLDSSDEGFNLYSKLGFKVYCVTSVYEKNKSS